MSSLKTLFLWRPARFWHDLKAESNEWVRVKVLRIGLPPLPERDQLPCSSPGCGWLIGSACGESGRRAPSTSMNCTQVRECTGEGMRTDSMI